MELRHDLDVEGIKDGLSSLHGDSDDEFYNKEFVGSKAALESTPLFKGGKLADFGNACFSLMRGTLGRLTEVAKDLFTSFGKSNKKKKKKKKQSDGGNKKKKRKQNKLAPNSPSDPERWKKFRGKLAHPNNTEKTIRLLDRLKELRAVVTVDIQTAELSDSFDGDEFATVSRLGKGKGKPITAVHGIALRPGAKLPVIDALTNDLTVKIFHMNLPRT